MDEQSHWDGKGQKKKKKKIQLHNRGNMLLAELSTSNEWGYKDSWLILNWYSYQFPNQSY